MVLPIPNLKRRGKLVFENCEVESELKSHVSYKHVSYNLSLVIWRRVQYAFLVISNVVVC